MPANTPRYLGPVPHPAIGVRIPEIFVEGILTAFERRRTAGGLMLSCTREAAPKYVIDSPPGKYLPTLGHTGQSITDYITKSSQMARKRRVVVEIEADQVGRKRSERGLVCHGRPPRSAFTSFGVRARN